MPPTDAHDVITRKRVEQRRRTVNARHCLWLVSGGEEPTSKIALHLSDASHIGAFRDLSVITLPGKA